MYGKTGKNNPAYGKKRPDLAEINRQRTGKNNPNYGKKNLFLTKMNKQRAGIKHHNWKNGISTLYHKIRTCFEYHQWRLDIFARDDYTCQDCGDNKGGNLNAHHIEGFANTLELNDISTFEQAMACEELWNINNGITCCKDCHKKAVNEWARKETI